MVKKSAWVRQSFTKGCYQLHAPPNADVFRYELATVPPALFQDDGSMRKSQKSQLAKHIWQLDPDITSQDIQEPLVTIYDGCALLHRIPWQTVGTLETVCESFLSFITNRRSSDSPVTVVFDSYNVLTTKDPEQKRRRLLKPQCPDMVVDIQMPVPSNKAEFLSNKNNKQKFLDVLTTYLHESGIHVVLAGDESDADVVIVKRAVQMASCYQNVMVIVDDTDVLILLLYHATGESNFYMKTKDHTISINMAKEILGRELCRCLSFVHAMSGCDTTSALYSLGKIKQIKLLQSSQKWRSDVLVFGDSSASLQKITDVGELFVQSLYGGGSSLPKGIDHLRYLHAISPKYIAPERLPPTSRACYFHCLRVHHQVNTWINLKTTLDKERHGFSVEGGKIYPILTDLEAAPPELLQFIKCSCKSTRNLCSSCNCSKKRLPCSVHCKCEGVCQNGMQRLPQDTSCDNIVD